PHQIADIGLEADLEQEDQDAERGDALSSHCAQDRQGNPRGHREAHQAAGYKNPDTYRGGAPVRWTVNCVRDRHRALSEGGSEVASRVTIVDPEGTVRSLVPR